MALVGLLLPAAIVSAAGTVALSLPAPVRSVLPVLSVLAFATSGVVIARRLGRAAQARPLGLALGVTGAFVTWAFGSLTGLSGREPLSIVVPLILAAFAAGFAVPAIAWGRRLAWRGAAAGLVGGTIALVPFLLTASRLALPWPYVRELLTVASWLGCVIVPYAWLGATMESSGLCQAARPETGGSEPR